MASMSTGPAPRFRDRGWSTYSDFADDALVRCPRCDRCARVLRPDGPSTRRWRVTCLYCAYAKDARPTTLTFDTGRLGEVRDPAFRLPLWLQVSCCGGNLLWAYNL